MKFLIILLFTISISYATTYKKISELATQDITAAATGDLLVVVDVSGTPTTKSISLNEWDKKYYSASYTQTATFNGNVTVATDKILTVTSSAYLKGYLILVSPDTSCSACSVDNSDTFSCTATACP